MSYLCGVCREHVESNNHICYKADPNKKPKDNGLKLALKLADDRLGSVQEYLEGAPHDDWCPQVIWEKGRQCACGIESARDHVTEARNQLQDIIADLP